MRGEYAMAVGKDILQIVMKQAVTTLNPVERRLQEKHNRRKYAVYVMKPTLSFELKTGYFSLSWLLLFV